MGQGADMCRRRMMLVGKHWDEPTIYCAAYAFEQAGEWAKM
jgi:amidase